MQTTNKLSGRKIYIQPMLNIVRIDSMISLQLNSPPPEMDNENVGYLIKDSNNVYPYKMT